MRINRLDDVNWRVMQRTLQGLVSSIGTDERDTRTAVPQYVFAVGCLFLILCRRFKMRPTSVLERVSMLIQKMEDGAFYGGGSVLAGVKMTLKNEFTDPDDD